MLQVEKKNKKIRKRWPLAILCALIAAGCAAWVIFRGGETPVIERTDTSGSITNRETDEIAWMRITLKSGDSWEAEPDADGNLIVSGETEWEIRELLAERIQDALANLVYEEILSEDPAEYADRLSDFGLDEPEVIAEVRYTDGVEMTIRFGNLSELEDADFRYMTIDGDDRLYAVADSLMEDLNTEAQMLHPVDRIEIQEDRIDRVRVTLADGSVREWALEGKITDSDAGTNWKVTEPVNYPADEEAISNLKKNAGNLVLGLYVAEGTEENLKEYGLDNPKAVVEVHMAAGSTGTVTSIGTYDVVEREEETVTIAVGNERNEMTDYALFGGVIYTLNHFISTAITELEPEDTMARYIVVSPLESLTGVEIERADGTKDVYKISTVTDEEAESDGYDNEEAVSYVCTKNGEEMNYETFSAVYARWLVVTVSGKLPDGWEKKETEIKYTFRTRSGGTHVVELSEYDALHDAVTLDGSTVFYLIHDGMTEMP